MVQLAIDPDEQGDNNELYDHRDATSLNRGSFLNRSSLREETNDNIFQIIIKKINARKKVLICWLVPIIIIVACSVLYYKLTSPEVFGFIDFQMRPGFKVMGYFHVHKTYEGARALCQLHHSDLLSLESEEEDTYVDFLTDEYYHNPGYSLNMLDHQFWIFIPAPVKYSNFCGSGQIMNGSILYKDNSQSAPRKGCWRDGQPTDKRLVLCMKRLENKQLVPRVPFPMTSVTGLVDYYVTEKEFPEKLMVKQTNVKIKIYTPKSYSEAIWVCHNDDLELASPTIEKLDVTLNAEILKLIHQSSSSRPMGLVRKQYWIKPNFTIPNSHHNNCSDEAHLVTSKMGPMYRFVHYKDFQKTARKSGCWASYLQHAKDAEFEIRPFVCMTKIKNLIF